MPEDAAVADLVISYSVCSELLDLLPRSTRLKHKDLNVIYRCMSFYKHQWVYILIVHKYDKRQKPSFICVHKICSMKRQVVPFTCSQQYFSEGEFSCHQHPAAGFCCFIEHQLLNYPSLLSHTHTHKQNFEIFFNCQGAKQPLARIPPMRVSKGDRDFHLLAKTFFFLWRKNNFVFKEYTTIIHLKCGYIILNINQY